MHRNGWFLLCAVLCWAVPSALADPLHDVRIDVTEFPGTPANWNQLKVGHHVTNLIDYTTGTGTGLEAYLPEPTAPSMFSGGGWNHGNVDWLESAAAESVIGNADTENPWFILFSNLSADRVYTVEVVAAYEATIVGNYTVNGAWADDNRLHTAGVNGENFNARTDGFDTGNWLIWNDVQPDTNGEIEIEILFLSGFNGSCVNAVRLTEYVARAGDRDDRCGRPAHPAPSPKPPAVMARRDWGAEEKGIQGLAERLRDSLWVSARCGVDHACVTPPKANPLLSLPIIPESPSLLPRHHATARRQPCLICSYSPRASAADAHWKRRSRPAGGRLETIRAMSVSGSGTFQLPKSP